MLHTIISQLIYRYKKIVVREIVLREKKYALKRVENVQVLVLQLYFH